MQHNGDQTNLLIVELKQEAAGLLAEHQPATETAIAGYYQKTCM